MEEEGYEFIFFDQGKDVLRWLELHEPAGLVLQLQLSDMDGLDLLRDIQEIDVTIPSFPIICLSNNPSPAELMASYKVGALDYLDKSVPAEVLFVKMRSFLRLFRQNGSHDLSTIVFDDLILHLNNRKVYRGDKLIKLTPKEFELLHYLIVRANRICERDLILQEVWGYDFEVNTNVVDVYIRHLRGKIDRGQPKKLIHTVRGLGYIIQ